MFKKTLILLVICLAALPLATYRPQPAEAGPPGYYGRSHADAWMYWHALGRPWHAPYYHEAYGRPVSMPVPPTANMQSHYAWGVTGTTMDPIYHQYARPVPPAYGIDGQLLPPPHYPSSTDQMGVYYIRAPW